MKPVRYVFLCNAVDDRIRLQRSISGDSPAATNKVFGLWRALGSIGASVCVLSMGRGRQNRSGAYFGARIGRHRSVPVIYADFCHLPVVTHLLTAISLMGCIWRMINPRYRLVVVVYNRLWHGFPAATIARLRGAACYLDLEDGDPRQAAAAGNPPEQSLKRRCFDWLCRDGALLASEALGVQTGQSRKQVCYGVAEHFGSPAQWSAPYGVLYGGSLMEQTGALWFIAAIERLYREYPQAAQAFRFVISGKGEMAERLQRCAESYPPGRIEFIGEVSRDEYLRRVRAAHIGLCLKLPSSAMGQTTFPSKTVEIAASGLLLVSAAVSDVPAVFGDTACLLQSEDPDELVRRLVWVFEHPQAARDLALKGQSRVQQRCSREQVGASLLDFLQPRESAA